MDHTSRHQNRPDAQTLEAVTPGAGERNPRNAHHSTLTNAFKAAAGLLLMGACLAASACAPQYFRTPCGCERYVYYPPPPLPYHRYEQCLTPTAVETSAQKQKKTPEQP